jgi:hypothetical protein
MVILKLIKITPNKEHRIMNIEVLGSPLLRLSNEVCFSREPSKFSVQRSLFDIISN